MQDVHEWFLRIMPALQRRGWNQKRVAEFLGMHPDQFSDLLRGDWEPQRDQPRLRAKLRILERLPEATALLCERPACESSPCAVVARRERTEAVRRAIGRLKPGEAMVVQKISLEGWSFAELAEDRAADEARLRGIFHRAQRKLAALPELQAALL